MNSVPRLQGIDLAKENYAILKQINPNVELHVDDSGKLYAEQKSQSIFGGIFGKKSALPDKKVELAKLKAQVWGHLIPEIKGLQAKERLSEEDARLIQDMIGEIGQLWEAHPHFADRMKELLKKMDESLGELACRHLKQPSAKEVKEETPPPEPLSDPLEEIPPAKEALAVNPDSHPQLEQPRNGAAAAAEAGHPEKTDGKENKANEKSKDSMTQTIGNILSGGVGLSASLAVGAAQGGLQIGLLPFRVIRGAAGVILAPNLVQRCLGLNNFKNAWQELTKSKVWIPARAGGKTGVPYTGPIEVERVIPGFRHTLDSEGEHDAARQGRRNPFRHGLQNPLERNPILVTVEIPETRVTQSLEGIDWEKNPLWTRLKNAGSEMFTGSLKLTFWALALYYTLGRYANKNEMCSGECNLDEQPTITSSLSDYASQLWNERANWKECDRLQAKDQYQQYAAERSFLDFWQKNFCDGVPSAVSEKISQQQEFCNELSGTHTKNVDDLQAQASAVWEEQNCDQPIRNTYLCEALKKRATGLLNTEDDWFKNLWKESCNIPTTNVQACESKKETYNKMKVDRAYEFEKNWAANFCDDEKPKPIFENLFADMKKNPFKYPMNFARGVDAAVETISENLSTFKEPAKATLRGLIEIGNYFCKENPMAGVYSLEAAALLGVIGNAELKARASRNVISSTGYRAIQLAAIVAGCWINTINNQAGALYNSAINFNASEAFGL